MTVFRLTALVKLKKQNQSKTLKWVCQVPALCVCVCVCVCVLYTCFKKKEEKKVDRRVGGWWLANLALLGFLDFF